MRACPCCGGSDLRSFYKQSRVPVNSVVLLRSREVALNFPTHRLDLCFCRQCGFIFNEAFDPSLVRYGDDYEETQAFSPTFRDFHERLAQSLVSRHGLHSKTLVEIGGGKGEFISRLCEIGENRGIGIDPTYLPERNRSTARDRIRFVKEFFGPDSEPLDADFVCCKMTLEHVPEPREMLSALRMKLNEARNPMVFFQLPDTHRVLADMAFWDIYYEHCSYFSAGSLARLFRSCGFHVTSLWREYDDQYLLIEANTRAAVSASAHPIEEAVELMEAEVDAFETRISQFLRSWEESLAMRFANDSTVVLWGGGSKAVAFLSGLSSPERIRAAVDVNPHKHHTFLPGLGHEVIAPERLRELKPDVVILMNPIYHGEVAGALAELGLSPTLCSVNNPSQALAI